MSWGRIVNWFKKLRITKEKQEDKPVRAHEAESNAPKFPNNNNFRSYTVAELRRIILINYPPFTWEKVGLLLYKEFTSAGKSFTKLQDEDEIPPHLVKCISNALYMFYKKELPNF